MYSQTYEGNIDFNELYQELLNVLGVSLNNKWHLSGTTGPLGVVTYTTDNTDDMELGDDIINTHLASYDNRSLTKAKLAKKEAIRSAYSTESEAPVSQDDVEWNGGFDSAIKLDAAKRLSEAAGLTEVTFFDTLNQGHVLTMVEAQTVILLVGGKFQQDLGKKQLLMQAIDTALTQEDLDLIIW